MARRVEKKSVSEPGADDLEILHPEREVTIAGRQLVVREYGFIEGLRLVPLADPLIEELRAHIEAGRPSSVEAVHAILGRHAGVVAALMAAAVDIEVEWVDSLGQDAGTALMFWWWRVNGPFLRALCRRPIQDGSGARGTARWADIYATLIAAGYGDAATIGRMTERQLMLHFGAASRLDRRCRADRLLDVNLAFAGGKDAETYLKALLKPLT